MRRAAVSLLGAAALLLGGAAPAGADVFGQISLLSASPFQQVEYAHDPAISGDGRYLVFDGSIGNVTGVWRRENRPGGNLEQVAGGDAELPSISQNGQYVSFTTNEGGRLPEITDGVSDPPHETHESPNVYVRDMSRPPGEAGAFTIASAVNGSATPLTYEHLEEGEAEQFGSLAAGRSALSADGRKVAFVTTAPSNLAGQGTPPLQVAVRNLDTNETGLVSVRYDSATGRPAVNSETGGPEPVPIGHEGGSEFGAAYTQGGIPIFRGAEPYALPSVAGASISADGSTVAWMGQQTAEQIPALSAEAPLPRQAQPLWRRVAEGEQTLTRQVTGGQDPLSPGCLAHPESRLPSTPSLSDPCQGPFVESQFGMWNGAQGSVTPRLSADGYAVAFISTAPLVALGSNFGAGVEGLTSDLYVADMHAGLTRQQALRPLTAFASGEQTRVSTNARILDFGIAADGRQIAFSTKRTVFSLGSPSYVSAPAVVPGLDELFDVDLANDTLTRVTRGDEGGAAEHPHLELGFEDPYTEEPDGAISPSFSGDGQLIAFSSTASNLVYGDGNTPPAGARKRDGSDAFVVGRVQFGSTAAPQVISPAPANPAVAPTWTLGVTAASRSDGSVVLYVEVPGPGRIAVSTSSSFAVSASPARRRAGRPGRSSKRGRPRALVTNRAVASAGILSTQELGGVIPVALVLDGRYRSLAAQPSGLSGVATITFTAPGHETLRETIQVFFKHTDARKAGAKRSSSKASRRRTRARGGTAR
jgi:hypothetical protein